MNLILCLILAMTGRYAAYGERGVTAANHQDRLKKGMKVKEVEGVFGMEGEDFPNIGVRSLAWRTNDGALIAIAFNREFRAEWIFLYTPEATWLEKISQFLFGLGIDGGEKQH